MCRYFIFRSILYWLVIPTWWSRRSWPSSKFRTWSICCEIFVRMQVQLLYLYLPSCLSAASLVLVIIYTRRWHHLIYNWIGLHLTYIVRVTFLRTVIIIFDSLTTNEREAPLLLDYAEIYIRCWNCVGKRNLALNLLVLASSCVYIYIAILSRYSKMRHFVTI